MAIESLGRMLIYIGVILVLIGGFFILVARVPWFGRLPGDLDTSWGGARVYVPFTTMVLVSIVLTILLNIVWRR
jgi:hypothetical protein